MPESRIDWSELASEMAALGIAESDEEDEESDEEADDEADDSEAVPFRPGLPPNIMRARAGNYGRKVQGRGQGVVQTPSGPARIQLPGKFITVDEFKKSVEAIQKDVQRNADGIKQVALLQHRDAERLTKLVVTTEKRMKRQITRSEIITVAAAAVAPFIGRFIDKHLGT